MKNFAYLRPQEFSDALAALAQPDNAIIAGGTELLNWMRLGIVDPTRVVDIARLAITGIRTRDGVLTIGAGETLNAVGQDLAVIKFAAVLSQACLAAASVQVRNRATIGGNILQKTRCEYFRAEAPLPWGCNKREPGSGCSALHGINERSAIIGWTPNCVATNPSDPAVALACLDAQVEIIGAGGRRIVPARDFHLSQNEAAAEGLDAAQAETRLRPDEIILAYHIDLRSTERSAYLKVRERASYEYALVSAAASLSASGGKFERVRLALGSIAQRPWRLYSAEAALIGKMIDRETIRPVIAAALADARPLDQNEYKVEMAINAGTRAVLMAADVE